jgi:hypothetical protein
MHATYAASGSRTYNPDTQAEKEFLRSQVTPIKWYPLVYTVCMIFPTINRIQNAAHPDSPIFPLLLLINSVIYAYNTDAATWRQCTPAGIQRAIRFRKGGSGGEFPSAPLTKNMVGRSMSNDSDESDSEIVDSDQRVRSI